MSAAQPETPEPSEPEPSEPERDDRGSSAHGPGRARREGEPAPPPDRRHDPRHDPEKGRPVPPDFVYYRELPETREADRRWGAEKDRSWGDLDERHWTRTRGDRNDSVIEYYQARSQAPGVREGGTWRNQYCMSCDGVLPLSYFQTEPADDEVRHCPHCGERLEQRIHRMFNWVEIDQPHDGDLKVFLPWILGLAVALAALLAYLLLS